MTAEKKTYRGRTYKTLPKHLPESSSRRFLKGGETTSFDIKLKTVTPILGGGYHTRELDDVDIIRVPTIRGHLRFWWRALYAHKFKGSEELYEAECKLWGGAGGEDDGAGKSKVELCVEITRTGETNKSNINLRDDSAYALWPARGTREEEPAPRRSNTEFTLTVICPKNEEQQVRNTLKAWILFGGYGSRTRRGLGSLTVKEVTKYKGKEKEKEDINRWLPKEADGKAINNLFDGLDPIVAKGDFKGDTPKLQGALLYVGSNPSNAESSWVKALNKLKEFRQGAQVGRESRMGLTRWPEADKVRKLLGRNLRCKYNSEKYAFNSCNYYWPRASFGLPLKIWFKQYDEHEIKWKWKDKKESSESDNPTRLASPLILKPLPLANGKYVPCALWLNRGYPEGEVFVDGRNGSEAEFDTLTASGDEILFKPLKNKETLRDAFLDWLGKEGFKEVE